MARPLKYTSPEDMQADIDAYFGRCTDEDPPTISGLAYHLDMTTESLRNYENRDEFFATVKKAKQRVEMALEKKLLGNTQCTGAIFNLKNNFGWKDKQETHLTGAIGLAEMSDEQLARIAAGSG